LATLLGIVAGDLIGDLESLGLEFAIVATFIAMTFSELRKYPILVAVIFSGVTAVLLKPLFNNSYIVISALVGMLAAYVCSEFLPSSNGSNEQ